MARSLTQKQQAFIEEYPVDLNGTQAAIRAGYSEKTANRIAANLLSNVVVQKALTEKIESRAKRTKIDADYVLMRLAEVDQMDVKDILKDDGTLKAVTDWPKIWRQFVTGMDVSEIFQGSGDERILSGLLKKIKWPDKLKNLELIGKHVDVQAWKEKVEHSGELAMSIRETFEKIDGKTWGLPE